MSIFLIRYVLKAWGNRPEAPRRLHEYIHYWICGKKLRTVDHGLQRGCMSIFSIRCVLKSYGNKPGTPRRIYEYIPY